MSAGVRYRPCYNCGHLKNKLACEVCWSREIGRLAARLKEAVKLLRRFETIDRTVRPHFLSSDVELFLRKIGGGDG